MLSKSSFSLMRRMSVMAKQLQFTNYGEPAEVLQITEVELPSPEHNNILLKILAAPINPADINTIQGKYPVKTTFPAIPGNECIGEIMEVGNEVKHLKVNDRVIPLTNGLGTWTSHAIFSADSVLKIPESVGNIEASTLTVNPCTAYRMLKDFVKLKSGDTIIQNGANSAVGQAVSQLCKAWGISNIGIVRNRPNIDELKRHLFDCGATVILTEDEIRSIKTLKDKYSRPKLGLNCVGGKSALEVCRNLNNEGIMVTYGGMSREPVTVPTSSLIFNDIQFRGFWMTRWTKQNFSSNERKQMFTDLFELIVDKKLKAPAHILVPLSDYKVAVKNALDIKGFIGQKYIFDFTK